jgi:phosphocarrier protein
MFEKTVKILNEEGLHARPAANFVKEANAFTAEVEVIVDGNPTNGKSIMGLMALGLTKDSPITIKADGPDAQAAVEKLSQLVDNKFEI